jgi:hypothetical protein
MGAGGQFQPGGGVRLDAIRQNGHRGQRTAG